MNLRPYQQDAIESVFRSWTKNQRVLGVAPTGAGKTILFANVTKQANAGDGGRTLILAHRDELIQQAADKLDAAANLHSEREQAEHRAPRSASVVVGSVQTLQGKRLQSWPRDHFNRLIIDEAHHDAADSYQSVLEHFNGARVLGVTATPDRCDKRSLANVFDDLAFEISMIDLVRDRYLAPIKVQTIPLRIDLTGVRVRAGDLDEGDVAEALEPQLDRIAGILADEYANRKTLVFLPRIETSKAFVGMCRDHGVLAEHVDGTSADRADILKRFSTGETQLVSNVSLLTEGYDEPTIDCIVCLRPTKSRPLYSQMVGRGTRLSPGKQELLLLDFLWISEKHRLIQPAHLVAKDDAEAEAITRQMTLGNGDLIDAKDDVDTARRNALAEELARNRNRKGKLFDALEFSIALRDLVTADYEPTMPWHYKPVSDKQAALLTCNGIDPSTAKNQGHAWELIKRLKERRALNLASPRQAYWLSKLGHPHPELCSFDEAKRYLDARWNRAA